jgi:peroxiredoxin
VRSGDNRQRVNLVLVFHHGGACSACRALLRALAARAADIKAAEAVVLAIGPDDPEGAGCLSAELGKPIVVLGDAAGAIAGRQGLEVPAMAVTDRFGELWVAWEGAARTACPTRPSTPRQHIRTAGGE